VTKTGFKLPPSQLNARQAPAEAQKAQVPSFNMLIVMYECRRSRPTVIVERKGSKLPLSQLHEHKALH
jgi:hypothetical protein